MFSIPTFYLFGVPSRCGIALYDITRNRVYNVRVGLTRRCLLITRPRFVTSSMYFADMHIGRPRLRGKSRRSSHGSYQLTTRMTKSVVMNFLVMGLCGAMSDVVSDHITTREQGRQRKETRSPRPRWAERCFNGVAGDRRRPTETIPSPHVLACCGSVDQNPRRSVSIP